MKTVLTCETCKATLAKFKYKIWSWNKQKIVQLFDHSWVAPGEKEEKNVDIF